MQFQVPQFIEVEDKLFGPLTLKQFIYLAGGAGATIMLWKNLPSYIALLFIMPIDALAIALAFYKVNGRPFISTLEAAFNYSLKGRLYLWKHEEKTLAEKQAATVVAPEKPKVVPKLTEGKLKEIAWSLDIKEKGTRE